MSIADESGSESGSTSTAHAMSLAGSQITEKVKQTSADLGAYAQEKVGDLKDKMSGMKDSAREMYDQGAARAQDLYEQGKTKAKDLEQSAEDFVRAKPVQAVLIAAGVGLAIGLLLRR